MRRCRYLAVVIGVYVTLDLSLASMPGAFVFDASGSVESVQTNRTPDVSSPATALSSARNARAGVFVQEVVARRQFVPMPLIPLIPWRPGDGSATAPPQPAPPSEDPH